MELPDRAAIAQFERQPVPPMADSLYTLLSESADRYADRTALQFFLRTADYRRPQQWTYRELMAEINQTAQMLADLGIGLGDTVSVIMPNTPATVFAIFAAQAVGIVNPINPLLEPAQMVEIMRAAQTKVLVTLAPFPKTNLWDKVSQIIDQVPTLETVLTVSPAYYLRGGAKLLAQAFAPKPKTNTRVVLRDFERTKQGYSDGHWEPAHTPKPDDVCAYFHTGGTTGKPKLAQLTQRNMVFMGWLLNVDIDQGTPKNFFCGLPWFHINGVVVTGLAPLAAGHCVVLGTAQGYKGEGVLTEFWSLVEHYQIAYFSSVPTILQYLLQSPTQGHDLSSLEYAFCGAAPLSTQLFRDFEQATGVRILEGYGFTEGTCVSSVNPKTGERKVGSVGLALAHLSLKVVILDQEGHYQRDANTDETGVIVARGPNIFAGYKEQQHNQNIWMDDGHGRWYVSGDIGRTDADGYFWITGRKKELIIRGGHNIDPKMIEEPLAQHPGVAAVAAVGRPDPRVGEVPVVYAQRKPGSTTDEATLMTYAQQHIPEQAAHPKHIYWVEALPLTAVGKVFKPELVNRQVVEVYTTALMQHEAVQEAKVRVGHHPQQGRIAHLQITLTSDSRDPVQVAAEALGAYTVPYEIEATHQTMTH